MNAPANGTAIGLHFARWQEAGLAFFAAKDADAPTSSEAWSDIEAEIGKATATCLPDVICQLWVIAVNVANDNRFDDAAEQAILRGEFDKAIGALASLDWHMRMTINAIVGLTAHHEKWFGLCRDLVEGHAKTLAGPAEVAEETADAADEQRIPYALAEAAHVAAKLAAETVDANIPCAAYSEHPAVEAEMATCRARLFGLPANRDELIARIEFARAEEVQDRTDVDDFLKSVADDVARLCPES